MKILKHGFVYLTGKAQLECPECNSNDVKYHIYNKVIHHFGTDDRKVIIIRGICLNCSCEFEYEK